VGGSFDTLLALTANVEDEGSTLIVGQVVLGSGGAESPGAELRLLVDGEEQRAAETRSVAGDGGRPTLVIACACEGAQPGEHEVELQARATGGSADIEARSLIALGGVQYENGAPPGGGPLPPAIIGSALEAGGLLVTGTPSSLVEARLLDGAEVPERLVLLAQVSAKEPGVAPQGIVLTAAVNGTEAERVTIASGAAEKLDVFVAEGVEASEAVRLLGRVLGGGNAPLDLRALVVCPCSVESAGG
jgi:hypothetical protein